MNTEALDPTDASTVDDADETDASGDEVVVLPWWQNKWNIVAIVVAVLVLAGGLGFVLGERNATPDPNEVDIGFLQDMRTHHEQAVEMSLAFLTKQGTDPTFQLMAKEIAFDQAVDSGRMIQLLRQFGEPEANQTDTAMQWMNQPVPSDRMPGMATPSDLDTLVKSEGLFADLTWANLMLAHHLGGIHMAEYAAEHAGTKEVRDFAASMVKGEQDDIFELQRLLSGENA